MVLLTLHFPSLRVIWSRSPPDTARLLEELKARGVGTVCLCMCR
jgi:ERCC4-type nuclease